MSHCSCMGTYDCGCMPKVKAKKPKELKVEFCASRLAKPDVFCTLAPKHVGPCSFYLAGRMADDAIDTLRARVAALEDAIRKFREHFQGAVAGTCGVECPECEARFEAALAVK